MTVEEGYDPDELARMLRWWRRLGGAAGLTQPGGGAGGAGTVTDVTSTTGQLTIATPTTTPNISIAKVPAAALVSGAGITVVTSGGKASVNLEAGTTSVLFTRTFPGGTALINGTQTIRFLTVPNDSRPHVILAAASIKHVTSTLTGGRVAFKWTDANGAARTLGTTVTAVGTGVMSVVFSNTHVTLKPGTRLALAQTTAATAGAAVVFAAIAIA